MSTNGIFSAKKPRKNSIVRYLVLLCTSDTHNINKYVDVLKMSLKKNLCNHNRIMINE